MESELAALEKDIEAIRERARMVWARVMRELEDAHPNPSLCLMEQGVRALGYAADAVRYARQNLTLTRLVHAGVVTLEQTGYAGKTEERDGR